MSAKSGTLAALLISAVLVTSLWLYRNTGARSSQSTDNRDNDETRVENWNVPSPPNVQSPAAREASHASPATADSESAEEKHEAYVNERVAQLADLGTESDPDSLNTILSELTNRDQAIRAAALEAAIQFGDREAIPAIREAMSQVDDPEEKATFAKGIDFLKLTNVTQVSGQSSPR